MSFYVYIVYLSVLRLYNLKLPKTLAVKNIFKQEKLIPRLTFNPRLALTGSRTTRPIRQRTIGSETTKDKAGALPPAVYAVHHTVNESEERLRFPKENNLSSAIAVPRRVVSIKFVDEGEVIEVFKVPREEIDEYETDSYDEESVFKEHWFRACQQSVCHTIIKDPVNGADWFVYM